MVNLDNVIIKFWKNLKTPILIYDQPFTENKPTGQAFVCFADEKAADLAFYQMRHTLINGTLLKIFRWVPKLLLHKAKKSWMCNQEYQKIQIQEPVAFFSVERYNNSRPEEKKRVFGEAIYQELLEKYGKWTGKITGMIIELDESELLSMMENKKLLDLKAKEAIGILSSHITDNN